MNKKQLQNKLNKFLETKVSPEGTGWPKVSKEDFETLQELVEAIIDLKWDKDCDGDAVIESIFINRNVERQSVAFMKIPYDSHTLLRKMTPEEKEKFDAMAHDADRLDTMLLISEGAAREASNFWRILERQRRKKDADDRGKTS